MHAWRVIVAWRKTMPRGRPTIRRWPIAWCVTQLSMCRSVASCAIPQTRRSNPPAIHRTLLTSTQVEMRSWTSPHARSAMELVFAAWGVTSQGPLPIETLRSRRPAESTGLRYSAWSVIPSQNAFIFSSASTPTFECLNLFGPRSKRKPIALRRSASDLPADPSRSRLWPRRRSRSHERPRQ